MMKVPVRAAALFVSAVGGVLPMGAAAQDATDLAAFSIEDLAQIEVRSASKADQPVSSAPTAIYVITGEAIEQSAATSLPEALRLAPNLQVQQVDAYQYAITARGFNSLETANKLLVLIDGRSVYTPLHSGVFWQLHSPLLEDIRQIEVISGPGGTLFGPNAVNGIVNVLSRDARDTLGGLVRGTAGSSERTAGARYGVPIGDSAALRVYGNWFEREGLPSATVPDIDDALNGWQAGFRADHASDQDHFTLQGDVFDNRTHMVEGEGNSGHNLLARWARTLATGSSLQLQAYYDRFERRHLLVQDSLETFDVEGQYNLTTDVHEVVLGAGTRTTRDEFVNNLNPFRLDPASKRLWVFNIFAQDRVRLSDTLSAIAGLKAERSSFSGFQLLPNLRLAWQPDEEVMLWTAVSRAVRTPSRIDRELAALPILAKAPGFRSEKLVAFEAGYRGRPLPSTSISVSAFYNLYDDIRTTELTDGGFPIRLANGLEGSTYGIEAWSVTQLRPWWRLQLGANWLHKDFEVKPGRIDLASMDSLGHDPDYQLMARSTFHLLDAIEATLGLRSVGGIDSGTAIDGYTEAEARIAYRVGDGLELYVAGSNLFGGGHLESNDADVAQLNRRSIYAGSRIRF